MAKKWIQGATSNAHGQFRRKAHQAGMTTSQYAQKMADNPNATPRLRKQAVLAKTLMGLNK